MLMMDLEKRIESFSALGKILQDALHGIPGIYTEQLTKLIENQKLKNPWFTPGNVKTALNAIAGELTEQNLRSWTEAYPILAEERAPSRIAVIFAGNIPLTGFHDFLSVLISGNRLVAKTSSKDPDLIPFLGNILNSVEPELGQMAEFTSGILTGFDAVIATGSNNSARYFEYYFGKYPHIIRKNRNSIAILEGDETEAELTALGKDIFTYFGLGCRNVSKIFIPAGTDPAALAAAWKIYSGVVNHSRYANNYDYNKAIYLVNRQKFHDTGFLLMKEDERLASPISVLHYEFYRTSDSLKMQTEKLKDNIQCITGRNFIPFGHTQKPHLWDYADGTDTLEFLLKKNMAGIL
jgi:hypothetical protein